jgi:alkylated DNA repair dioxygenase AlkB
VPDPIFVWCYAPTAPTQQTLFDQPVTFPHGLLYRPNFLTADEEKQLLAEFARLPFKEALFQQYTARRRAVRYGEGEYPSSYGNRAENANPRGPFPEFLLPFRRRIGHWLGIAESSFVHVLCTEYRPGTPIGWHCDAPISRRLSAFHSLGKRECGFDPMLPGTTRVRRLQLSLSPVRPT